MTTIVADNASFGPESRHEPSTRAECDEGLEEHASILNSRRRDHFPLVGPETLAKTTSHYVVQLRSAEDRFVCQPSQSFRPMPPKKADAAPSLGALRFGRVRYAVAGLQNTARSKHLSSQEHAENGHRRPTKCIFHAWTARAHPRSLRRELRFPRSASPPCSM